MIVLKPIQRRIDWRIVCATFFFAWLMAYAALNVRKQHASANASSLYGTIIISHYKLR
jgi:hypothetical protein